MICSMVGRLCATALSLSQRKARGFIGWTTPNRNSSMSAAAPERRRIAYLRQPTPARRTSPALVWLSGLQVGHGGHQGRRRWRNGRGEQGIGCLRFDYSGHGQSEGRFEDGTLSRWLEETRAVFEPADRGPAGADRLQHGRLHRPAAAARADGRGARGGRAHQGPGADRAGLGHDRADVEQPARPAPAARSRRRASICAPRATGTAPIPITRALDRGRPRAI